MISNRGHAWLVPTAVRMRQYAKWVIALLPLDHVIAVRADVHHPVTTCRTATRHRDLRAIVRTHHSSPHIANRTAAAQTAPTAAPDPKPSP